jgi:hypothetical protein
MAEVKAATKYWTWEPVVVSKESFRWKRRQGTIGRY